MLKQKETVKQIDDNKQTKKEEQNINNKTTVNKGGQGVFEDPTEQENQHDDQGSKNGDGSQSNDDGNEDMRNLKEFKVLISEKTVPKSIKILQRTVFVLGIIIIVLTAVELSFKIEQTTYVKEGVTAITKSYMRHNIMVDVNYYARKTWNLANGYYIANPNTSTFESEARNLQNILASHVDQLQVVQFDVIKSSIKKEERNDEGSDRQTYDIEFQLQNGEVKVYQNIFTDAMFQYITAASSLTNSTISSFVQEDIKYFDNEPTEDGENNPVQVQPQQEQTNSFVESTRKNFFFVRKNGLFVLRDGSESKAIEFFNFYDKNLDDYEGYCSILMILGIVFLCLSQCVLIPIVFDVHKCNNKVLSLFGIIPEQEIKDLAIRCEKFMIHFLDDRTDKKEQELDGEQHTIKDNHSQMIQQNQNQIDNQMLEINNEPLDHSVDALTPDQIQPVLTNDQNLQNGQTQQNNRQGRMQTQVAQQNSGTKYLQASNNFATQPPINNSKINSNNQSFAQNNNLLNSSNQQQPQQPQQGGLQNVSINMSQQQFQQFMNQQSKIQFSDPEQQKLFLQQLEQQKQAFANQQNNPLKQQNNDLDEQDDIFNLRSMKLMNSKDNTKKLVIPGFMFIAIIFIVYFVVNFLIEISFIEDVRLSYNHLKLCSMRPSLIKYNVMFTLEELVIGSPILENNQDIREYFTNLVYENERQLFSSYKEAFPTEFDSYKQKFKEVNYDSICEFSTSISNSVSSQEACGQVSKGILKKGLRTAVVALAENTRDIISKFRNTQASKSDKVNQINSQDYISVEEMKQYIIPTIEELNTLLLNNMDTFLNSFQSLEEIKFSIFIVVLLLVLVLIWIPYLQSLNNKIWRTKGMLNMIPMDIITKYDTLKEKFIKGDILQSVK